MRKTEGRGDEDVGKASAFARSRGVLANQRLRLFGQRRQHDEQAAGHERREQRVTRPREHRAVTDRRQRGDEAWQHPETQEERQRDIAHEIHLQPLQLLEAQRTGRRRGDGEQSIRRQPNHVLGAPRDSRPCNPQRSEQALVVRHTAQRHAGRDAEDDDRGNEVF
jgi:hypothetical protein